MSTYSILAAMIAVSVSVVANAQCTCPSMTGFNEGTLSTSGPPACQCAYDLGSCVWDSVCLIYRSPSVPYIDERSSQTGTLLNTGQANCPVHIDPADTASGICPTDATGASGTLINRPTPFTCTYVSGVIPTDTQVCSWNAVCLQCII